jgi:hypothetical protein
MNKMQEKRKIYNIRVKAPTPSQTKPYGWQTSSFELKRVVTCHTRFLRPKPDAHRMYAQDQVVIHTVRM